MEYFTSRNVYIRLNEVDFDVSENSWLANQYTELAKIRKGI